MPTESRGHRCYHIGRSVDVDAAGKLADSVKNIAEAGE